MNCLRAIETGYKGYRFRSRLEARWAVFFDACGVNWEYEPEGFILPNGRQYLPDFLLHDVTFNHADHRRGCDLYVEVKGEMTEEDAEKIRGFAFPVEGLGSLVMNPLLVVGNIPAGETLRDLEDAVFEAGFGPAPFGVSLFNFETVDGDYFGAMPSVGKDGKFQLFGADSTYTQDMNRGATERAYRLAQQARFEFGETPRIRRYRHA